MHLTRNRRGIEEKLIMTIETIKEFAYSTQQHLLNRTGSKFKRTHVYELLATIFGYNSFAALSAEAIFSQLPGQVSVHTLAIKHKCVELGYQHSVADVASSELLQMLIKYNSH